MRTFKVAAAQGEITFRRVPEGARAPGFSDLPAENGVIIVGHSETGHHHVMDARNVTAMVKDKAPEGMRILRLIVENPTPLVHQRGNDTHEPILFEPGTYEVRIGREYDPFEQIARRVAD